MSAGIADLIFLSPRNYVTIDFCTFFDKDIRKIPNLLQRLLTAKSGKIPNLLHFLK